MPLSTKLQIWRLLPAYAINGLEVALGIGCIQQLTSLAAGEHVAALVVSGAVSASIADLPNSVARNWRSVGVAVLLSALAALVVDLLRGHPLLLGAAVAVVAFFAMMALAWGARAGAVSFSPVLSMIFSMAVPPSEHPLATAGWSACGGLAFLAWSTAATAVLQRRYRSLVLMATLRAAAELFRSRADVLSAARAPEDKAEPMRAWISGEATLADRLQAARDLLFAAPGSTRSNRDIAMLTRVIDLRDILLASRLDAELLGADATGRAILQRVGVALRRIGDELDAGADHVRDGSAQAGESPPLVLHEVFADLPMALDDPRARWFPSLVGRLRRLDGDVRRIHRLLQGQTEPLPLTREQLKRFMTPRGFPLRALRPHWRFDSPVLRHALRMGLALGAAYYLAFVLPWSSHPWWLVLSVGVVLRGNLGDTLARRNARVAGTLMGCLVVVGLSYVATASLLSGVFLAALATAHAFVAQRYWLTATAASVMALLQSHLVNPEGGFAIAERVADTFLGALLAWCFSYVLPSWERRGVAEGIARVLRELHDYASQSLRMSETDPLEARLARRRAYDSLAALSTALRRSRVEPKGVRLPATEIATLIDHGERLMAHLSMVRLTLARLKNEAAAPLPVNAALEEAARALDARLDLQAADTPAAEEAALGDPELLPEQPAARDVMPWLTRRLSLMVVEAGRIRRAARSALAV